MDVRKNSFPRGVVGHWSRLNRRMAESQPLEVLRKCVDLWHMGTMLCCWLRVGLRGLSLNDSV